MYILVTVWALLEEPQPVSHPPPVSECPPAGPSAPRGLWVGPGDSVYIHMHSETNKQASDQGFLK